MTQHDTTQWIRLHVWYSQEAQNLAYCVGFIQLHRYAVLYEAWTARLLSS